MYVAKNDWSCRIISNNLFNIFLIKNPNIEAFKIYKRRLQMRTKKIVYSKTK